MLRGRLQFNLRHESYNAGPTRRHGGYVRDIQRTRLSLPVEGYNSKQRNMTPATDAENELVLANTGLAIMMAKKMKIVPLITTDYDDVVGFCYSIILSAIREYDPSRGTQLSTLVCAYIAREFANLFDRGKFFGSGAGGNIKRPKNPLLVEMSLDVEIHEERENTRPPPELLQQIKQYFDGVLYRRYHDILCQYLGIGQPIKTVAQMRQETGLTSERIYQLIDAGLMKICKHLELPTRCLRGGKKEQSELTPEKGVA